MARLQQLAHQLPVGVGDGLNRIRGHAGRLQRLARQSDQRAGAVLGLAAAAQNHRVAGLEAQGRDIDGHVRTRLEYGPDHTQRHASSGHLQAVGQPACVDRLAHRVGEADDDSQRVGDPVDPR